LSSRPDRAKLVRLHPPSQKQNTNKRVGGVAQVVQCSLAKEALSSIPNTTKKNQNKNRPLCNKDPWEFPPGILFPYNGMLSQLLVSHPKMYLSEVMA
jgi:hypothetical protein